VYDSQRNSCEGEYREMKTMSKIISFMEKYYDVPEVSFYVYPNFPQQFNSSDCGVMMLCGIKDTVKDELMFSFEHSDMYYKRALITKEIVEGNICGF
jgi:Ulp1 family protease